MSIEHLFMGFSLTFETLLLKRGEGVKHTPSTQHSQVAEMMITLILNCRDSFIIIMINIQKENATLFFWGWAAGRSV